MGPFEAMLKKVESRAGLSEDDPWQDRSALAFAGKFDAPPHPVHVLDVQKEAVWAFYVQFPSASAAEATSKRLNRYSTMIGTAIAEPRHYKQYGTGVDKVRGGSVLRISVDSQDRNSALRILQQEIQPWTLLANFRGHGTPFESMVDRRFEARIDEEHRAFCEFVNGRLDEFNLPGFLKEKVEFIKSLAASTGKNVTALMRAFTHRSVFGFFAKIGWSLVNLWDLLKKGFHLYEKLIGVIAEYLADSPVGKWTEERLSELDSFLEKHPVVKAAGGPVVAGLLVYIWLNMTFTGNFVYDFDFSLILLALTGKYSLSKLFSGKDGHKLLLLLATGMLGLTFPWPGPTSAKFTTAVVVGLLKLKGGHVP